MYISRILSGIIIVLGISMAHAQELHLVVSLPPGSQQDIVARAVSDSVSRTTDKKIVIHNMPGAEGQIAVQNFKNSAHKKDIIGLHSGMVIFNPGLKKDLPYSRKDFVPVVQLGQAIVIWVTRPNTRLRQPEHLVTNLPHVVGSFSSTWSFNLFALIKERNVSSEIVNYKGWAEAVSDIQNGSIDLALVTMIGPVLELVKAGKLHVVGSSYHRDLTVDGIEIPSVSRRLNIPQFNGLVAYAVQPTSTPEQREQIRDLIWNSLKDPVVQEALRKAHVILDPIKDTQQIEQQWDAMTRKVINYNISK